MIFTRYQSTWAFVNMWSTKNRSGLIIVERKVRDEPVYVVTSEIMDGRVTGVLEKLRDYQG